MARALSILILDDNEDNADALAELLAMDDHRVQVAYSGQDAVDAYRAAPFDLGFFDVMMPGKNGVESFLEIRQQRPDAKIYFMTGYSADDLLKTAMVSGAMGVFGKPVDLPRVLEIVGRVD
jgi:two-component system, NtrC family, response regulator HydG